MHVKVCEECLSVAQFSEVLIRMHKVIKVVFAAELKIV